MTRILALSLLWCACGSPAREAAPPAPSLGHAETQEAVAAQTDEAEVAEAEVAEVAETREVALAEAAPMEAAPAEAELQEPEPMSAQACEAHAWQVVARDLEQTLRNFEELAAGERLSLRTRAERERRCVQRVMIPDLDGDGREEMDLTAGCTWNWSWPHMIFLSTGCRYAGQLWSADSLQYLPRANSIPDVVTHSQNGCAGWDFEESRYRWNGTRYEMSERVMCDFCEDPGAPPRGPQPARCDREQLSVRW
ncbi:MAG: hypothetical protein AB8H86_13755 [Polyangiales bacterium]